MTSHMSSKKVNEISPPPKGPALGSSRGEEDCDGAEACEGKCDQHTPEDFQMLKLLDAYAEAKSNYDMMNEVGFGAAVDRAEKAWDAVRITMSNFLDSVTITKKEQS